MDSIISNLVNKLMDFADPKTKGIKIDFNDFVELLKKTVSDEEIFLKSIVQTYLSNDQLLKNVFDKIQKDPFILNNLHLYASDSDVAKLIYTKVKRLFFNQMSLSAQEFD
ncbi:hypothetical protein CCFV1_ORF026 [Cotesia congregata filamentous virus 1]|uniref:Uncharacterized protein n=1 Tax=Cotesia congregata filamentous virus 1 TaxID=3064291 RepID=A0ABC8QPM8_9VIRU|nr:hypothetical protein CCFV1_ORF026 [Cotesia congregata filamentous virus 1]